MIDYATWISETNKERNRHEDEISRLKDELIVFQRQCKHGGEKQHFSGYNRGDNYDQCLICGGEIGMDHV